MHAASCWFSQTSCAPHLRHVFACDGCAWHEPQAFWSRVRFAFFARGTEHTPVEERRARGRLVGREVGVFKVMTWNVENLFRPDTGHRATLAFSHRRPQRTQGRTRLRPRAVSSQTSNRSAAIP